MFGLTWAFAMTMPTVIVSATPPPHQQNFSMLVVYHWVSQIVCRPNKRCAEGHGGCSHPQVIFVEGQAPARAMAQMTTLSSAPMDESHDPICGSARMRALIALVSRR
jgi:hypothetical protein